MADTTSHSAAHPPKRKFLLTLGYLDSHPIDDFLAIYTPNGISIESAIFPQYTFVTSVETDRQNDDGTCMGPKGRLRATGPLCENMTSSTKPEGHNILQRRQRRTEEWLQVTCTKIEVWFSSYASGHMDTKT